MQNLSLKHLTPNFFTTNFYEYSICCHFLVVTDCCSLLNCICYKCMYLKYKYLKDKIYVYIYIYRKPGAKNWFFFVFISLFLITCWVVQDFVKIAWLKYFDIIILKTLCQQSIGNKWYEKQFLNVLRQYHSITFDDLTKIL